MDLPPPADLLDRPAKESARLLALSFLQAATEARQRLEDARDREALHDFRVALRRLRSCLRAYGPHLRESVSKRRRRRLRDLAAATGASRDAEVHLAWLHEQRPALRPRERPGVSWLIGRLTEQKQQADVALRREVAADFEPVKRQLESRLVCYTREVRLDRPRRELSCAAVMSELVYEQAGELERCLAAVRSLADQD